MQKWRATRWVADYTMKATPVTKIMMRVLELSNAENFITKGIWQKTNYNIKTMGNSIMISKIIRGNSKWELYHKINSTLIPK
jgi:hypothetical protein